MKFLIQTAIIIILTAIIQMFLPWWGLMVACFIVSFFAYHTRSKSFFSGFVGVGMLWIVYATYIDVHSSSILTTKVAQIFNLPQTILTLPNTFFLILITGIVGGIPGGFSALTGHLFREFFTRKEIVD